MHRTLELAVPTPTACAAVDAIRAIDGVIGLTHHPGASVTPPGDVLTVHALNRSVDDVLRAAERTCGADAISVVTAEVASMTDARHQRQIDRDVDEAIWEELETGLRHQGRITSNYLALMALGGAIGAIGAVAEPSVAPIAYVASAVVAPGFEPVAKLPLGMALRRWKVFEAGLLSTVVGYAVLIAAAALTWLALALVGGMSASSFLEGDALKHTLEPSAEIVATAIAGAFAGAVILASYRRSVIAGALVAMRLIEAASVTGIALALGRLDLATRALERVGMDMGFVVLAGLIVFCLKQFFVHRRRSLR